MVNVLIFREKKNERRAIASVWSGLFVVYGSRIVLSAVGNVEFLSLDCLQLNSHVGKLEDLTMDYRMTNYFSTRSLEKTKL